jgi:hypothetical protein
VLLAGSRLVGWWWNGSGRSHVTRGTRRAPHALHCAPFTARPSPRALHCSPFTARPSLLALHRAPFTARPSLLARRGDQDNIDRCLRSPQHNSLFTSPSHLALAPHLAGGRLRTRDEPAVSHRGRHALPLRLPRCARLFETAQSEAPHLVSGARGRCPLKPAFETAESEAPPRTLAEASATVLCSDDAASRPSRRHTVQRFQRVRQAPTSSMLCSGCSP